MRERADGCYVARRACKMTRLEGQVKGYVMKSCPSKVLRVLELRARTILETASVLAIAMWISDGGKFAKE